LSFKADSVLNSKVCLTWNPVSGANGYKIKRATVAGGPYTTVATTSNQNFTDTGLINNTTYYYVVTAINSTLESAASDEVSAKPMYTSDLNESFENKFQLFPNPASKSFKIAHAENSKIVVTDSLGKLIWTQKQLPVDNQIDVSNWNSGIYYVQLIAKNYLITKKLIVTR